MSSRNDGLERKGSSKYFEKLKNSFKSTSEKKKFEAANDDEDKSQMRRASSHPQATAEPRIRSQSASIKQAVEKMRRSSSAIPMGEKHKSRRHCTACGSASGELFRRGSGLRCLPCLRLSEGIARAEAARRKASIYAPEGSSPKHSSPTEIEPTTSDSRAAPADGAGVPVVPPLDFTKLRAAKQRAAPFKYNTPTYSPSTASEVSTVPPFKPSIPTYEHHKGVYALPTPMPVTTKSMTMAGSHKPSDMRATAAAPAGAGGAGDARSGPMADASGPRPPQRRSRAGRRAARAAGPPSGAPSRAKPPKGHAGRPTPGPGPKTAAAMPWGHQSPGLPPGGLTVHCLNAVWSMWVGQEQ